MCRNCGSAHLSAILASLVHVFLFCRGRILSCSWRSGCDLGSASQMYSHETWSWNWGKGREECVRHQFWLVRMGAMLAWFWNQQLEQWLLGSAGSWSLSQWVHQTLLGCLTDTASIYWVSLYGPGNLQRLPYLVEAALSPFLTTEKMENQYSRALPVLTRWLELTFNFTFLSVVWLQPALLLLFLFVD